MLSAAAGNATFISRDLIKWSGFQVMGESLLPVLQCQHQPYQFVHPNEAIERAILETDISEEELDAKSRELEPQSRRTYAKSHSTGQWIARGFARR
jgi:hypothetical protein